MRYSTFLILLSSWSSVDASKAKNLRRKTSDKKRQMEVEYAPVNGVGAQNYCDDANNILAKKRLVNSVPLGASNMTKIGKMTFSERFKGLNQDTPLGILGLEDALSGLPTSPLTLEKNFNHRENLYITKECEKNEFAEKGAKNKDKCHLHVKGRGPAGFKGLGAISFIFAEDQSNINLRFWSDGTSTAAVYFYTRDAKPLGVLYVDLGITDEYIFARRARDIAGIAITPLGEQMEWHKFGLVAVCAE